MSDAKDIETDKIVRDITEKLSVPLWPTAGKAFGLSRSATYKAGNSGEIPVNRIVGRLTVPTSWLRQKLALNAEAA